MLTISLSSALLFIAQGADTEAHSFDDLGNLLLGGILLAILLAIAVAFLKLRSQNKRGAATDFVSINPARREDRN
jgi:hypothetical protein